MGSLTKLIYRSVNPKETYETYWNDMVQKTNTVEYVAKYLKDCEDSQFPEVTKNRRSVVNK